MEEYKIDDEEKKINVKVEKHLWPDEVAQKRRALRSRIITITIFSLVFLLSGLFLGKAVFQSPANDGSLSKFAEIEKIMTEEWYFGKDIPDLKERIKDQSIQGLSDFPEYDIHTYYLSKEDMEQFTSNLSGSYVGIGIQFYESEGGSLIVKRVFENSPAQKGGIIAGDILIKANNKSLIGLSTEEVRDIVLGEEGSQVDLVVLRDQKEEKMTLTRATVLHSVFGEVIGDVGYIELDQFGESTSKEVLNYFNKFKGKQNKLILDLRDNGGGYLTSVVDIASYLIDEKEIVLITEDNKGKQYMEYSNGNDKFKFEKIVVLVNENTASASEVLTAALSEHLDNVTVVGTNTYGKGTVQHSRIFEDGSAMKYTTAEWLTPRGNKINKVGIKPDVEVNLHPVLSGIFPVMEDNQTFTYNSVGVQVAAVQSMFDFLSYDIEREDGYFDKSLEAAINEFKESKDLIADGVLDKDLYEMLISKTIREWNENTKAYDTQLEKALVIINE